MVTGFGLVDEMFQTFMNRCNCVIQQIMTQLDQSSIVEEMTNLIRLLCCHETSQREEKKVRMQ